MRVDGARKFLMKLRYLLIKALSLMLKREMKQKDLATALVETTALLIASLDVGEVLDSILQSVG